MNADELMIGDWVIAENKPTIVEYPLCENGCAITKARGESRWRYYLPSSLRPATITSEILEKNGFDGGGYKESFTLFLDNENDYVDVKPITRNPDYKWLAEFMTKNFSCRAFINSVHELQHLLKLCGTGKEIEL